MATRISIPVPIRVFPQIDRGRLEGSVTINGEEVKNRTLTIEAVRRATTGIDTARIVVNNTAGTYTGKWTGGETIEIKFDFGAGSTTVFKGFVTAPTDAANKAPRIELACSGYGIQAFKNPVYENYTVATDIGQIFATLVGKYLPGHTATGVNTTTGITAMPVWQGKDLFNCFQDLAITHGANNYDFFVDENKDWSFFVKGSKVHDENSGIAIVYGQNLRNTQLDKPFAARSNKVTVQGTDSKGQMIIATRGNPADQAQYWKMADTVRDDNLTTLAQVKAMADYLIANGTKVGRSGTLTCDGMPGLRPGYAVMAYDPNNNINGYVVMSEIKHTIEAKYYNEVKVNEQIPRDSAFVQLMKSIKISDQKSLGQSNVWGMENSFPMAFDDTSSLDTAMSSHVSVQQGRLVITSGYSAGTAVSVTETAIAPVTQGVLEVSGSGYEECTFKVALDGSGVGETLTPDTQHTFASTGTLIKVIVSMVTTTERPNPSIENMVFKYT